jgi:hypothetical protein
VQVDQWLANAVTGLKTDYISVRAKSSTVIDYRRANLEVRKDEATHKADRRLEKRAKLDGEKPDRPLYFGHLPLLQPYDDVIAQTTTDELLPEPTRQKTNDTDKEGAIPKMAYGRNEAGHAGEQRLQTSRLD